ncbi:hypothetical protein GLAREA_04225 [Glarea lozoyensis ATCC 20868]|uniref:2EXR domain-containing protein n=1 Tax=Glarea lozoyensis (strain ATCC 20868 / MF5171) TaxID=1116229 RepID=S3CQP4_GLAL2|nr:uncharacterized protein GLAREA_04225 [Glarea lozoyensis ATCC 20868]EPE27434.1 hypothetical protein GLAREA_04225 [Glarea lozoyensis ATCC 20868]
MDYRKRANKFTRLCKQHRTAKRQAKTSKSPQITRLAETSDSIPVTAQRSNKQSNTELLSSVNKLTQCVDDYRKSNMALQNEINTLKRKYSDMESNLRTLEFKQHKTWPYFMKLPKEIRIIIYQTAATIPQTHIITAKTISRSKVLNIAYVCKESLHALDSLKFDYFLFHSTQHRPAPPLVYCNTNLEREETLWAIGNYENLAPEPENSDIDGLEILKIGTTRPPPPEDHSPRCIPFDPPPRAWNPFNKDTDTFYFPSDPLRTLPQSTNWLCGKCSPHKGFSTTSSRLVTAPCSDCLTNSCLTSGPAKLHSIALKLTDFVSPNEDEAFGSFEMLIMHQVDELLLVVDEVRVCAQEHAVVFGEPMGDPSMVLEGMVPSIEAVQLVRELKKGLYEKGSGDWDIVTRKMQQLLEEVKMRNLREKQLRKILPSLFTSANNGPFLDLSTWNPPTVRFVTAYKKQNEWIQRPSSPPTTPPPAQETRHPRPNPFVHYWHITIEERDGFGNPFRR